MTRHIRFLLIAAMALPAIAVAQPQPNPVAQSVKVKSPEVLPDGHITFRLYAPSANTVTLNGSWIGASDLPLATASSPRVSEGF